MTHGFPAFTLENDRVRMVIVPALGAKITSLVDKTCDYEWLAPPTHPIRARTYGDVFTDHDLSGWDEMFPTIDVCPSPFDPAVSLPDHGEVWALPWDTIASTAGSLTLRVNGRALNYTLTRTITLLPDGMRLDYTAENHAEKALPYVWAAHPLFNGGDTEVVLPADVKQVVSVDHPRISTPDVLLDWDYALLPNGEHQHLGKVRDISHHDYRKFYVPPDQRISSAALRQMSARCQLSMTWDDSAAPYLGVWIDQGTYTTDSTVALEPASGYYDSLERAQSRGRITVIPAGGRTSWWVTVRLSRFA